MAAVLGTTLSLLSALVISAPARAVDSLSNDSLKTRAIYYLAMSQPQERDDADDARRHRRQGHGIPHLHQR